MSVNFKMSFWCYRFKKKQKKNEFVLRISALASKKGSNQKRSLTLKTAGGGRILPGAQEIACHFSQDHTMVTKFLDFIKKHPKYKVVKSFFYYLDRCSRNSAEAEPRS